MIRCNYFCWFIFFFYYKLKLLKRNWVKLDARFLFIECSIFFVNVSHHMLDCLHPLWCMYAKYFVNEEIKGTHFAQI